MSKIPDNSDPEWFRLNAEAYFQSSQRTIMELREQLETVVAERDQWRALYETTRPLRPLIDKRTN